MPRPRRQPDPDAPVDRPFRAPRNCEVCGRPMWFRWRAQARRARYCSRACAGAANRRRADELRARRIAALGTVRCVVCKAVIADPYGTHGYVQKCCSVECRRIYSRGRPQHHNTRPERDPTAAEIAARAAEIRRGWNEHVRYDYDGVPPMVAHRVCLGG
jgi:hypothetical protein